MKYTWKAVLIFISMLLSLSSAHAENHPYDSLNWQVGPTKGTIDNRATIHVPDGYVFLGKHDTKKLMEMMQNIPGDNEYVFAPDDLHWFAVFSFRSTGYIKDDETLDADSLLETMTEGTKRGNIERKKRGWSTMSILGWRFQPRYDKENNLLEWAFLAKDDSSGEPIINYNTRLLGRKGVMEVVVVADPATLDSSVASFKDAIQKYDYMAGERYADYRDGDRVAKIGLAALVAGGAAAVASKKGFWGAIVSFLVAAKKLVIVAVIGFFAFIGSIFKRNK